MEHPENSDRTMSDQQPPVSASPQLITFEAVVPSSMALIAEQSGVKRASTDPLTVFVLSVLAGAFISFGAIFATTVGAGSIAIVSSDGSQALTASIPYGVTRLLMGAVFSVGLLLVVIGGAELFTGNNMIVMAWASRKVTTRALLLNWIVAFAGNAVGAIATAALMFLTAQYSFRVRFGWIGRVDDGERQGFTDLYFGADSRHHVQCTCLSRGVDVLRCSHHDRQGRHHRAADRRFCDRRIRAQHRQSLFRTYSNLHQVGRARLVLESDRQICLGF